MRRRGNGFQEIAALTISHFANIFKKIICASRTDACHLRKEVARVLADAARRRRAFAGVDSGHTTSPVGSFAEVRATYAHADVVGPLVVFNIGGNKYRLIAAIHFNRAKVYVRHVLTHPSTIVGTGRRDPNDHEHHRFR